MKLNLSQIECLPVRDADGGKLGHVWDLRTEPGGDESQGRAISSLLIGPVGLMQRLGLKLRGPGKLKCADVAGFGHDAVLIKRSP